MESEKNFCLPEMVRHRVLTGAPRFFFMYHRWIVPYLVGAITALVFYGGQEISQLTFDSEVFRPESDPDSYVFGTVSTIALVALASLESCHAAAHVLVLAGRSLGGDVKHRRWYFTTDVL